MTVGTLSWRQIDAWVRVFSLGSTATTILVRGGTKKNSAWIGEWYSGDEGTCVRIRWKAGVLCFDCSLVIVGGVHRIFFFFGEGTRTIVWLPKPTPSFRHRLHDRTNHSVHGTTGTCMELHLGSRGTRKYQHMEPATV